MNKIPIYFVGLLCLFFITNVNCLDFCGAEDVPKCKQDDEDCVINKLEPGLRKWIIKAQPGYFMEQLDPMIFTELAVETNKGVYKLKNVKLTGFSEAKLINSKWHINNNNNNNTSITYTYVHKFELLAEDIIDQSGKTLLNRRPLLIQLDNLQVETKAELIIVERCDEKYAKFTKFGANVRDVKDEDVNIKFSLNNSDSALKQALAQIVGKAATRKISENYRTLAIIVPISAFYN